MTYIGSVKLQHIKSKDSTLFPIPFDIAVFNAFLLFLAILAIKCSGLGTVSWTSRTWSFNFYKWISPDRYK